MAKGNSLKRNKMIAKGLEFHKEQNIMSIIRGNYIDYSSFELIK